MKHSYSDIADRLEAFKELAKLICLANMIPGLKDTDMAFLVLVECELTGQTILQWHQENHIICGQPTMRADAMVAAFNSREGCRVKMLEKSPEVARILVMSGEDEQEFSVAWKDAQREPWVYEGKESDNAATLAKGETPPRMKAKYSTPLSRANMLYARCVSNAIRTVAPEVTKGKYTPEEVEDFSIVDGTVLDADPRLPKKARQPKLTAPANGSANGHANGHADTATEAAKAEQPAAKAEVAAETATKPADAPEEPATLENEPETAASYAGVSSASLDESISPEQDTKIRRLLEHLKKQGVDLFPAVKAKLKSSGIGGLAGLTIGEADLLIKGLEAKEIEHWAETQLRGHAALSPT